MSLRTENDTLLLRSAVRADASDPLQFVNLYSFRKYNVINLQTFIIEMFLNVVYGFLLSRLLIDREYLHKFLLLASCSRFVVHRRVTVSHPVMARSLLPLRLVLKLIF